MSTSMSQTPGQRRQEASLKPLFKFPSQIINLLKENIFAKLTKSPPPKNPELCSPPSDQTFLETHLLGLQTEYTNHELIRAITQNALSERRLTDNRQNKSAITQKNKREMFGVRILTDASHQLDNVKVEGLYKVVFLEDM